MSAAFALGLALSLLPAQGQAPSPDEARGEGVDDDRGSVDDEKKIGGAPLDAAKEPGAEADGPRDAADEIAAELADAEKIRVLVPDFRASSATITEGDIETITALAAFQLSRVKRFGVISGADIAEMLRVEGEKQALGCSEESSCLAEIAGAFDARLILFGQIGLIGSRFVVNLSLIDSRQAEVISRTSFQSKSIGALSGDLRPAISKLTRAFGGLPGGVNRGQAQTQLARQVAETFSGPDTVMMVLSMGIGSVSICLPLLPIVPIAQGLAFWLLGDDLAGREYPAWWAQILIGYFAHCAGVGFFLGIAGLGLYLQAYFGFLLGIPMMMMFAGTGLLYATLLIIEPVLVWVTALFGAHDALGDLDEVEGIDASDTPPVSDVDAAPAEDDSADDVTDAQAASQAHKTAGVRRPADARPRTPAAGADTARMRF